jgi:hypothetical protein
MGNSGIKRRKVRHRLPPVGDAAQGGWEMQTSPYTFEGEIEGLSRFGRGVGSLSPRMRLLATIVALTFIVPFLIGIMYWVFD